MKFLQTVLAILLCVGIVYPQQSGTGQLSGTVGGPSGLLPGATIELTDIKTGRKRTTTSSSVGVFSIPTLDSGIYIIKVTVPGFKTYQATDIKIDVGRVHTLDAILEIGEVSESMTVSAGAEILSSAGAALGTTVTPREVLELPLNGRNPLALVGLQAGATPNRAGGSEIINGARTASTNFTRDGIVVGDIFIRNGFVTDMPTVDNTDEFTVTTQNAGAQSGFGSSQVNMVTPRGGNDFHGALFLYNRNSKFSSNNFFANAAGRYTATDTLVKLGLAAVGEERQPRQFLNRNQFGGKISGPIPMFKDGFRPGLLKDRAHFFFSTEKFLLRQQTVKSPRFLRSSARNGIFAYRPTNPTLAAGQCITFINGVCTVNVLTGEGMTGAIPASAQGILAVDPIIKSRILDNMPVSGNREDIGDGLNTIGLGFNQSDPADRVEYTTRLDVQLTPRHAVKGTYRYNNDIDARTDIDSTFSPNARAKTEAPVHLTSIGLTSAFNSFTNEFIGGFSKVNVAFLNGNLPNQSFLIGGIPLSLANPELNFRDQGRRTTMVTMKDNASWLINRHQLKFGGEFQIYKAFAWNQASVGIPTFNIATRTNPNTPILPLGLFPGGIGATTKQDADNLRYLLGGIIGGGAVNANVSSKDATSYSLGIPLDRDLQYNTLGFYADDSWRVTSNLTLNVGLRYELYTPLRSLDGLYLEPVLGGDPVASVLDPNGVYDFVGKNSGKAGNFNRADKNNFAPSISFAYTPNFRSSFLASIFGDQKTVIRGGFQVSYVNDEYIRSIDNAAGGNAGLSLPVNATQLDKDGKPTPSLNARPGNLPTLTAPPFVAPPRTYSLNNALGNNFGTVFGIDPELQVTKQYDFNFGIQRQIGQNSAFEIRYVGRYSNDLVRTIDYNQIDIRSNGFLDDYKRAQLNFKLTSSPGKADGDISGKLSCVGCQSLTVIPKLFTSTAGVALGKNLVQSQILDGTPAETAFSLIQNGYTGGVKFLPNSSTGVANLLRNAGKLRHNSLQTEFRRRLSKGLLFSGNYTFQKTLTDITDDGVNQARVNPYLDNQNSRLEYSRAAFDATHTFNFSNIYELPIGKGKALLNQGGIVDFILGGWQFNNIVSIDTGVPISITDARGTLNRTLRSANQTANSSLTKDQIKDLIGIYKLNEDNEYGLKAGIYLIDPKVILKSGRASDGYKFDGTVAANQVFFSVNPGETGKLERYFINGPISWNWDASLMKNFRIKEGMRFQFRAEAFNVTNSTRYSLATQPGTFNINSDTFGRLTTASAPRIIQFVGRLEF